MVSFCLVLSCTVALEIHRRITTPLPENEPPALQDESTESTEPILPVANDEMPAAAEEVNVPPTEVTRLLQKKNGN